MRVKRLTAMLLWGAMLLCMLPLPGFGEDPVTWSLEGGVLNICGSGQMRFSRFPWEDRLEEIQSICLDEHITAIQDGAFSGCTKLNSVILSADLRYIGDGAFRGCESLSWITLPAGLVGIGEEAFADCPNLRSVFVPQSVSRIGDRAFDPTILLTGWTNSATDDYIKDNGGYFTQTDYHTLTDASGEWGDLSWKLEKGEMTLSGTGAIPEETLEGYPWDAYRGDITSLVVGSGITNFPRAAFALCRKLTQVTLPETVMEIDGSAFRADCTIYGVSGSLAETYAAADSLPFMPLEAAGEPVEEPAGDTGAPVETTTGEDIPTESTEAAENGDTVEETAPIGAEAGEELPSEAVSSEGQETVADTPTLTVASITAQPGQQIRLPISLSGNPGLCGLSFAIFYDKTILTLEDYDTTGELLRPGDWTVGIGEGEKAVWLQPDAMENQGEILTLVFQVAGNAPRGEAAVQLLDALALDEAANPLELFVEPGTVHIAAGISGDVNGDGRVTQSDAKRLRRYLSGQDVAIENGNADLNADGTVNIIDLALLNRLVGKE